MVHLEENLCQDDSRVTASVLCSAMTCIPGSVGSHHCGEPAGHTGPVQGCMCALEGRQIRHGEHTNWHTHTLMLVSLSFGGLPLIVRFFPQPNPNFTIPLLYPRCVCVLVLLCCVCAPSGAVQQLRLAAFWVWHSAGLLDSRDKRGPAIIKEFTQDWVI